MQQVHHSLFIGFVFSGKKWKGKILMPINYPRIKAEWDEGTMVPLWSEPEVGGRELALPNELI